MAEDPRSLRAWAAGNQGSIERLQEPGELPRFVAGVAQQLRDKMVRLGLADRCFQASDLAQAVTSIRALLG